MSIPRTRTRDKTLMYIRKPYMLRYNNRYKARTNTYRPRSLATAAIYIKLKSSQKIFLELYA